MRNLKKNHFHSARAGSKQTKPSHKHMQKLSYQISGWKISKRGQYSEVHSRQYSTFHCGEKHIQVNEKGLLSI